MKKTSLLFLMAGCWFLGTTHTQAQSTCTAVAPQHQTILTYPQPGVSNDYSLMSQGALMRNINVTDGHIRPGKLLNLRTNTTFVPTAGSEEFAIAFVQPETPQVKALNRKGWKVTADSWCRESDKSGAPAFAIDGNAQTYWHSNYKADGSGEQNLPHELTFDLGKPVKFSAFGYLPREGNGGVSSNGNIKQYELYISNDKKTWTLVKQGTLRYDKVATVWVPLEKTVKAKYVRLKELSAQNGQKFGACAEFYLSDQPIPREQTPLIKASDLKLKDVIETDYDSTKSVQFVMEPYTYRMPVTGSETKWQFTLVFTVKQGNHFLRKYLEITPLNEAAKAVPIDYIEIDRLGVEGVKPTNLWTHPAGSRGEGGMSAYTLTLGEPFYIDGMFFGSEFPQAENEITDGFSHSRYYVGKPVARISNMADGGFRTWHNVEGATRSNDDFNVVRQDFFSYINSIARPIKLRMQYNSWYDWMMRINEKRINDSFKEMERGFSQHGVRPMDSYVVDDGWNNYGVTDEPEFSGNTPNKSGFWEFNSKFPNGLKGASDIAHRYGSDFGIWLGPRGGYNFNLQWGKLLEKSGYGTYNRHSADAVTGDSVYIKKLLEFFLHNQKNYGVNYWKLDGFSTVQPQPSQNNRYITGGKNGNYYFTEHWERWYKNFEKMYDEAHKRGSDLWLNLTCYINPSPWILQWCNSVWMQNSMDMGRKTVDGRERELDKLLSYRDDRYYDFINSNQIQFPLAHLFNHDPIYGKEYGVPRNGMTDSEFRAYLYMMATRGTAFWEMLYSYPMMDEGNKWMINAEAMKFIENNYDILRHAIYFGKSPLAGDIYGYSCWKPAAKGQPTEGIVSFRNPSNHIKDIDFVLNNKVGVPESAAGLYRSLVMDYDGQYNHDSEPLKTMDSQPFAYGEHMKLTLQPGQILIYKFSANNNVPVKLVKVKANQADELTLVFDKAVHTDKSNYTILQNGKTVAHASAVAVAPDYRTVTLQLDKALNTTKPYAVRIDGVKGWNDVKIVPITFDFFVSPEGKMVSVTTPKDLQSKKGVGVSADNETGDYLLYLSAPIAAKTIKGISGKNAMTIMLLVKTDEPDAPLVSQDEAYSLKLTNGRPKFTVGHVTYSATQRVNDGKVHQIIGVREPNGMVKIYVDGSLQGTAYDANHVSEALPLGAVRVGGNAKVGLGDIRVLVGAMDFKAVENAAKEKHL